MNARGAAATILLGAIAAVLPACERPQEPAPTSADAPSAIAAPPVRVVSLSPAITRTLLDLGAGAWIVGRTPYCRGLGEHVPVVGDLLAIDPEALRQVEPELVLVQPSHGGVQPAIESLAREGGFSVEPFPIDSLEDLEGMIDALPRILLSRAGDVSMETTRAMVVALGSLREAMREATSPLSDAAIANAGSIVVLFSIEPPMAFGEGTFVDGLLGRLGVSNAITARGYPELSFEDLVRLDPAAVLLLRESDLGGTEGLAKLEAVGFGSARGRVRLVVDEESLVPGSGWIGAARKIRRTIESLAAIDASRATEPIP